MEKVYVFTRVFDIVRVHQCSFHYLPCLLLERHKQLFVSFSRRE